MSIETQSKVADDSRAEIDKIVVSEGEDIGRIQDVDAARRLAESEDDHRGYVENWHKERGNELGKDGQPTLTERTREGMKGSVESDLANTVMNRVVVHPKVEEDKSNGVISAEGWNIGYHPDVSSEDLSDAYDAARERYEEIKSKAE